MFPPARHELFIHGVPYNVKRKRIRLKTEYIDVHSENEWSETDAQMGEARHDGVLTCTSPPAQRISFNVALYCK